jgi:hypothetical protein
MILDNCTVSVQEYVAVPQTTQAATMSVTDYFARPATFSWEQSEKAATDNNTVLVESIDSGHRWIREGLQAIAKLGAMDADWHESEIAPPNPHAVALATDVLRRLSDIDFEPSSIDPSTGEGICIYFSGANRTANIECFNTGEILAATIRKGGEPLIWEVTVNTIRDGLARIYEFIGG